MVGEKLLNEIYRDFLHGIKNEPCFMKFVFIPFGGILSEFVGQGGFPERVRVIFIIRHVTEITDIVNISQHKQHIFRLIGDRGIRAVGYLSVGLILP